MSTIARVAFNVRASRLFDYYLPAGYTAASPVGLRVLAPFGSKEAAGVIIETAAASTLPAAKIKTLSHIYDDMPPLPPATLQLIRFCADYYHTPIGIATGCVLPAFFRRANIYRPPAGYCIRPASDGSQLRGNAAAIYALLQDGAKTTADIKQTVTHPHGTLKKLLALKLIERCEIWQGTAHTADAEAPPPLSSEQQQTLAALTLTQNFAPHLLFGATGSGKSEIYLHAAAAVLEQNKQVLILTPEIHLTPQLENLLYRRFPTRHIAVLHSDLSDGERARRWLMARLGKADIVLGTRLAVFTPMPALGLIIIDEEHDEAFKQQDSMTFSARNVAVWRAKNENIPIITGSATPMLESLHNARRHNWRLLNMQTRINSTPPQIDIIRETDTLYHGMDSAFVRALTQELASGRQCLIFINRRGYAPALLCRQCHQAQHCPHCSSNMTVHRRRDILSCHLCGHTMALPTVCLECGGKVIAAGTGTQRIEEELARMFPAVRILRIDRDSIGYSDPFTGNYHAIQTAAIQLLVGTQLISKGHNFPQLSFIGILNADAALAASDLRAEERLFALLSQVIGRGTRNPNGCRVLIQTRYPDHPFYSELQNDDVNACWQRLLDDRRRSRMPPFAHLAILRGKDTNQKRLAAFMQQTVTAARRHADGNVRIFDAVAPPIEKISKQYRLQILIHASQRRHLQAFLRQFLPTLPDNNRWSVDVDPLNI